jgi:hypothetical protein
MDYRRPTVLRPAAACAALAIVLAPALAGCGGLSDRPDDRPTMYFDLGDVWKTTKRQVRFYDCRTGSMVCTGPASSLDVEYQCRCD